ncbi:alginate lyase family protein [Acetobacteraceae bacterium H6797]|nr:alginate lyase family protein [Acetobacteraceae bacterium H6797]
MRFSAALPFLMIALALTPGASQAQRPYEPLLAPFDIEAINAAEGRPLPAEACPAPPPAVRDMTGTSYYTDPAHSRIDEQRLQANQESSRPMTDWLEGVEKAATRWVMAKPRQPEAAACALAQLDAWAKDYALMGFFNQQGGYLRKWTLGGAALAFLAIRDAPGLDEPAKARVSEWLRQVALSVKPYYDRAPKPGLTDVANNHLYWAGLAVAAAGIASGDRALLEWGVGRARYGFAHVTAEGALPLELMRGPMALHYHLFALQPLAALARMGGVNRVRITGEEYAALRRLMLFTFRAVKDPARIELLAGATQEDPWLKGSSPLSQGAGLEIGLSLVRDPEIEAAIKPFRPYQAPWLGGPVSLLWRLTP